jgi:hypothetical protein
MAHGTVITAKGKKLDFAKLVMKARQPIAQVGDPRDNSVVRQTPPPVQLNVRGHMPSHANIKPPVATAVPAVAVKPHETRSLADYTGVKIDEPKHLRERPENPMATANEALAEIMTDLEKYKGRDPKAAKKA